MVKVVAQRAELIAAQLPKRLRSYPYLKRCRALTMDPRARPKGFLTRQVPPLIGRTALDPSKKLTSSLEIECFLMQRHLSTMFTFDVSSRGWQFAKSIKIAYTTPSEHPAPSQSSAVGGKGAGVTDPGTGGCTSKADSIREPLF